MQRNFDTFGEFSGIIEVFEIASSFATSADEEISRKGAKTQRKVGLTRLIKGAQDAIACVIPMFE